MSPRFRTPQQNNLRWWKNNSDFPLVQLIDDVPSVDTGNTPEYLLSEAGIKEIAQYCTGYAVSAQTGAPWSLFIVLWCCVLVVPCGLSAGNMCVRDSSGLGGLMVDKRSSC